MAVNHPPEGDGLVCVWCGPAVSRTPSGVDSAMRLQACRAALAMAQATNRFNLQHLPDRQLPTRVGLNVGIVTAYSDAGIAGSSRSSATPSTSPRDCVI